MDPQDHRWHPAPVGTLNLGWPSAGPPSQAHNHQRHNQRSSFALLRPSQPPPPPDHRTSAERTSCFASEGRADEWMLRDGWVTPDSIATGGVGRGRHSDVVTGSATSTQRSSTYLDGRGPSHFSPAHNRLERHLIPTRPAPFCTFRLVDDAREETRTVTFASGPTRWPDLVRRVEQALAAGRQTFRLAYNAISDGDLVQLDSAIALSALYAELESAGMQLEYQPVRLKIMRPAAVPAAEQLPESASSRAISGPSHLPKRDDASPSIRQTSTSLGEQWLSNRKPKGKEQPITPTLPKMLPPVSAPSPSVPIELNPFDALSLRVMKIQIRVRLFADAVGAVISGWEERHRRWTAEEQARNIRWASKRKAASVSVDDDLTTRVQAAIKKRAVGIAPPVPPVSGQWSSLASQPSQLVKATKSARGRSGGKIALQVTCFDQPLSKPEAHERTPADALCPSPSIPRHDSPPLPRPLNKTGRMSAPSYVRDMSQTGGLLNGSTHERQPLPEFTRMPTARNLCASIRMVGLSSSENEPTQGQGSSSKTPKYRPLTLDPRVAARVTNKVFVLSDSESEEDDNAGCTSSASAPSPAPTQLGTLDERPMLSSLSPITLDICPEDLADNENESPFSTRADEGPSPTGTIVMVPAGRTVESMTLGGRASSLKAADGANSLLNGARPRARMARSTTTAVVGTPPPEGSPPACGSRNGRADVPDGQPMAANPYKRRPFGDSAEIGARYKRVKVELSADPGNVPRPNDRRFSKLENAAFKQFHARSHRFKAANSIRLPFGVPAPPRLTYVTEFEIIIDRGVETILQRIEDGSAYGDPASRPATAGEETAAVIGIAEDAGGVTDASSDARWASETDGKLDIWADDSFVAFYVRCRPDRFEK